MTLRVDYDLSVPMGDGVVLATDVFRPEAVGRYPVILLRMPYGKHTWPGLAASGVDPLAFVRAGYVFVIQDCRGTGGSGGEFGGAQNEGPDGAQTIAWAAAQPWSNGRVAMMGGSYMGATQLLAAGEAPPALRAIAPYVTSGWEGRHQGGALKFGLSLGWAAAMELARLAREAAAGADTGTQVERVTSILADLHRAYRELPLIDVARISPGLDATYGELLRHPEGDRIFHAGATAEHAARITTPGLHIAGWHDFNLESSLLTFNALRQHAATEQARENQRLIVTPWSHGPAADVMGDVWLGSHAGIDLLGEQLAWFAAWLKDEDEGDRVKIFVQGANRWRTESDWPLARVVPDRWYLHTGGKLSRDAPHNASPAEYVYDPADPVPTTSGQAGVMGADGAFVVGPRDRGKLHGRPDVLLYVSGVLQEDYEVTGPIRAWLHVSTSAPDTDFTAALIDVLPDGRAIGVTDGILRLRYREGGVPRLAEPERVYAIEVDMVATSIVFLAGHRVAVEISSSNFPRFDRNPNHGGVIAEAAESDFVIARQRVFHDADRASYVLLPSVPTAA